MADETHKSTPAAALEPVKTDVAQKPYKGPAAGRGALLSVLSETWRHSGVAKGSKLLLQMNQPGGFDCPGCAWPDPAPEDSTAFEFCENGAKAMAAEATRKRVTPDFFQQWSVGDLLDQSDHWLEGQGRITHPMVLEPGATHYAPISWDAAFKSIAKTLHGLDSPDEAVFYTSGRTSNEAAFLYQLLVRAYGTNNLPDCSNMCHESSGVGLSETIGIGKGTVSLKDFDRAEAIFVIGQNPGTNHPRMLTTLEAAAKRGCAIVSINPLRERALEHFAHPQDPLALVGSGTPISSLYLQVRVGGDVALLKGMMKILLEKDAISPGSVLDESFMRTHTEGFEEFEAALKTVSWDSILEQTGLSRGAIEEAAEIYAKSKSTIICWAMGLTQHKNGVGNIQEVVNLLLLKGNLGKPGAGACPVRGHSNVQGDRTVGIVEQPSDAFLDALQERFRFEPPREHGLDVVNAIHAMHRGEAKFFMGMGGNFVSATPDTAYTEDAIHRCDLSVHVSTKLNRSHLITGKRALILPCLGRSEVDKQRTGPQFVSCENSMSIVTSSQGKSSPPSKHCKSEPAIVGGIALEVLGSSEEFLWQEWVDDYDEIRELIEATIPGFESYNERVRVPGGFLLPNGVRERSWDTSSGKAHFTVHPLPDVSLEEGHYIMATVRSHDQYNTTVYGLDDRYRGIYGERRVVMMAPKDIAEAKLQEGQLVDLISHFEGVERTAPNFIVVKQSLPTRCVMTYFPEANVLVPVQSVAKGSNTPSSKYIDVTIGPARAPVV